MTCRASQASVVYPSPLFSVRVPPAINLRRPHSQPLQSLHLYFMSIFNVPPSPASYVHSLMAAVDSQPLLYVTRWRILGPAHVL